MLARTTGKRSVDEQLWDAMLVSRMNVLYYERLLLRFERYDMVLRMSSALFASAGVAAAVRWLGDPWTVLIGAVAGTLGVLSPILNFNDRIKNAAAFLPRYVEHMLTLRRLWENPERDPEVASKALDAFDQTHVAEAEKIRAPDKKLLEQARQDLCNELGVSEAPGKPALA